VGVLNLELTDTCIQFQLFFLDLNIDLKSDQGEMSETNAENYAADDYENLQEETGTDNIQNFEPNEQLEQQMNSQIEENDNNEYNAHASYQDDNVDNTENAETSNNGGENFETEIDPEEPEQFRKLFIGSLNYITTEEAMRSYFGQYGHIVDCVIMKEPKTNK
jgi:RNA recognition motif-containing protein